MAEFGRYRTLARGPVGTADSWPPRKSRRAAHRREGRGHASAGHAHPGRLSEGPIGFGVRHRSIDWLVLGCIMLPLITALAGVALLLLPG
jgi:hypothetical protein